RIAGRRDGRRGSTPTRSRWTWTRSRTSPGRSSRCSKAGRRSPTTRRMRRSRWRRRPSTMPGTRRARAAGTPTVVEPMHLTGLYKGREAGAGDTVAMKGLADGFEETGDTARAAAARWLVEARKVPYRFSHENELCYHHQDWREGWWWWTTSRERNPWGYSKG